MMDDQHDLELLLRSRIPLIIVETQDEKRVEQLFSRVAIKSATPIMSWSTTTGLQRIDFDAKPQKHASEPTQALGQIKATHTPTIYLMMDFHPYLDDPYNIRLIKEIALDYENLGHTLVLVSHALELPGELGTFSARFKLSLPNTAQLEDMVREEARSWISDHPGGKVITDPKSLKILVDQLRGLTAIDARRIIRNAIHDDGTVDSSDISIATQARYNLLKTNGALSCEFETTGFAEVGGLKNLKEWILKRRTAFIDSDNQIDIPKGILLVGVQGGGKSLAARAVAGMWNLPLLQLDFGTLYNKFFGETERNLREALDAADAMSPCVLWIDEIEKAIASGDYDSGTSRRILGNLLTWMSERTTPVFIVATANVIEHLPPELIRKGRLDEVFFVDLPDHTTRMEIFRIHLEKRDHKAAAFDLEQLAQISAEFSGAEIEQAVVSALYLARDEQSSLTTEHISKEISQTRPLAHLMAEKITRLRQWAADRTVPAN